jgi:hypothetical protein
MKTSLVLSLALCCAATSALAVKFNPDAMRTMRSEGEKIAQQAMQPRTFRLPGGLCLTLAKGGVVTAPCQPQQPAQVWRFDELGRVVHSSGVCLAVAGKPGEPGTGVTATACGKSAQFLWRNTANGQLINGGKACLHATGDLKRPGSPVIVSGCQAGPNQLWK